MGKYRKVYEFKLPGGATFPLFAAPPDGPGKFLRLISIELGPEYEFTLLSRRLAAFDIHYADKRTFPCFKKVTGECPWCGEATSTRWEAYAAVYSHRAKSKGIVRIPEGCYKANQVLRGAKGDLSGAGLKMWRVGGHKRGRVLSKLDLLGRVELPQEEIIDDHDLKAQLFWIWGVRTIEGEKNEA